MIQIHSKTRFVALAMLLGAGGALVAQAKDDDAPAALPAEQVIGAIRAAVEAKPGRVLEVENETEKGAVWCEVKVLAADGKTYEIQVDAATGRVESVELDDDADNVDEN